jgi:hypothetical protein
MRVAAVWPQVIDFNDRLPIVFQSSEAPFSSDGGLFVFRQLDERLALTSDFAAALDDPRDPGLAEHTTLEMVRQRVYGILANYEDQNDADTSPP